VATANGRVFLNVAVAGGLAEVPPEELSSKWKRLLGPLAIGFFGAAVHADSFVCVCVGGGGRAWDGVVSLAAVLDGACAQLPQQSAPTPQHTQHTTAELMHCAREFDHHCTCSHQAPGEPARAAASPGRAHQL
jgi:hypothetical protein